MGVFTAKNMEHLGRVIDTLGTAIIIVNLKGEIGLVNRSAAALLKRQSDSGSLVGVRASEVLHLTDTSVDQITANVAVTQSRALEGMLETSAGEHVPVTLSVGVLRSDEGRAEALVYSAIDMRVPHNLVQDLRNKADEMQRYRDGLVSILEDSERARKRVEDASREIQRVSEFKSQFLSNMSHELRTPLNNIIGYTDIALHDAEHALGEKQTHYLDRVMANAKDLLDLINKVLDVTSFDRGRQAVRPELFELGELIETTINLFALSVRAKGVTLRKEVTGVVPAMNTDRMKTQSIIKNLLSNAIKFTQEGEIVVRCAAHPSMPGWVRMQVIDTGIGIAPADQKAIFDEFRQVDGSTTRSFGGAGLGLAITKRHVTLLGGSIEVASEPRKGSVFTVDLPVELKVQEDTDTTWSTP